MLHCIMTHKGLVVTYGNIYRVLMTYIYRGRYDILGVDITHTGVDMTYMRYVGMTYTGVSMTYTANTGVDMTNIFTRVTYDTRRDSQA